MKKTRIKPRGMGRNIIVRGGTYYFRRRLDGTTIVLSMGIPTSGGAEAFRTAERYRQHLERELDEALYYLTVSAPGGPIVGHPVKDVMTQVRHVLADRINTLRLEQKREDAKGTKAVAR